MSRICFLVDDLRPPERNGSAATVWPWVLAEALIERGDEVVLLHAPGSVGGATASDRIAQEAAEGGRAPSQPISAIDLANAAERAGAKYIALRSLPPAYDVPLFPASEIHRRAHDVAAALRELRPDHCCTLDTPALAAIAIELRRSRADFAATSFSIVRPPELREAARMKQDDLPAGGRDEIIHDYLERRAVENADALIVSVTEATGGPGRDSQREFGARLKSQAGTPVATLPVPTTLRDPAVESWREVFAIPAATPARPTLPRVTVCMPFYEQPDFLEAALASLAEQTQPPHELIVMDDGSKSSAARDAFAAAERKYAPRGWKFLRQTNAGPAAARNRMVELASGDAVLFCDADNRFRREMIATMATALVTTGADCVTCAFQTFNDAPASTEDRGYVFSPLSGCVELGLLENVLGDTNFLVRKTAFLEQGGFTGERLADEDWLFLLQLLLRGGRVETVPAVLFAYRRMETSRARRQGEFASAAITVAPVLAQAPAAWRRLWPHLVAALRNPQAAVFEHQLEAVRLRHQAELAGLQQQIGAVEHDLEKTRFELRRSRWEHEARKASVEAAYRAREEARAQGRAEADRTAKLNSELAALQREHGRAVAELSGKVKRMQATWSWQATAPARAVRRMLIDPMRRGHVPATGLVAVAPRLERAIDEPRHWDSAPIDGVISGWCLIEGTQPPAAVRVRLDDRTLAAELRARPDVLAAHRLPVEAAPCGFELRYRLEPDLAHRAVLEAQDSAGSWHVVHEAELRTSQSPRDARDYGAWVRTYGTVTPEKATSLRQRLAALSEKERPLVSVVMPVHNAPERWLRRAIESVREQIYDRWELCVADDASSAAHVRNVLEEAQRADVRIRVVHRSQNGHISAASNSALELATGEWVALLDHDDELSPDALAEMVLALATRPDADVVYSDEDKIDEEGRRSTPYFKPDFLPDLLLGQNCISHLALYRGALVRKVGGFRAGYEGSQDWDLALRVIDETTADRVLHVPKVLYHWRTIAGSTAVAVSAKDYSVDSARRALLDHFSRRGIGAEVRPVTGHHWQIVYPLPERPPLVSIIIPTRDRAALLRTCVGSIFARTEYRRYEVLIVDNGSVEPETKELFAELEDEDGVRILPFSGPFNFSAINNFAAREANGSVLCFLNNDIEVVTGRWLDEMVSHALRPEIGAVGAMLYYPNNTIQHAGVILGLGGVANHAFLHYPHGTDGYMNRARLAQNYSAVTAACLVVRKDTFEKIGGFNEKDLAVAFNDIDLCLRVRALGLRNLWTPFAELYHHESASRGNDNAPEHQQRFVREIEYMRQTWGSLLDRDPAYNPNLALNLLGWQLAWPPRAS